jgi:SAM-dependent methyltransferase/uncharacterized protein YbaR (Trm112 family)
MHDSWHGGLVDPVFRRPLRHVDDMLIADDGTAYPVVDGIPVLLRADLTPTHRGVRRTFELARACPDIVTAANLTEPEKQTVRSDIAAGGDPAKAVIRRYLRRTNGNGYRDLAPGEDIPIPCFPITSDGALLLDIGCGWGRWSIAAAHAGFRVIGIDPMLGLLMAAKRYAAQQGIEATYICADARALPFANRMFDQAFSYSVLQHCSDADCTEALREIARTLKPDGASLIQMANRAGIRSLWGQALRGFREPTRFEVRYRALSAMQRMFTEAIGPTVVNIDCFFGLGLQGSDVSHMRPLAQLATRASELLKRAARIVPALRGGADSVFMASVVRR